MMKGLSYILPFFLSLACYAQKSDQQKQGLYGKVRMLKEIAFGGADTLQEYRKYVETSVLFNEQGNIITLLDSNAGISWGELYDLEVVKEENEYDARGKILKKVVAVRSFDLDEEGDTGEKRTTTVSTYSYDRHRVSEIKDKIWNGSTVIDSSVTRFVYDSLKNITEEYLYTYSDTGLVMYSKRTYTYDDNCNLVAEDLLEAATLKEYPVSRMSYNDIGQLVTLVEYDETGYNVVTHEQYEYDKEGRVSAELGKIEVDVNTVATNQYFDIDKQGNPHKIIKIRRCDQPELKDYDLTKTTIRQIEYYP